MLLGYHVHALSISYSNTNYKIYLTNILLVQSTSGSLTFNILEETVTVNSFNTQDRWYGTTAGVYRAFYKTIGY